jgi:quinoprotein glucose dehydrogenase
VIDVLGLLTTGPELLACRTVEDRVAMYRKHLGKAVEDYAKEHDRVRLIEDRDGDGKADRATVFADGFNNIADGIDAGVLARRGEVWYACIPHLWLLRDRDGDGKADTRRSLHSGYGVHVAYYGHDLHGLRLGPDGKLYNRAAIARSISPSSTVIRPSAPTHAAHASSTVLLI